MASFIIIVQIILVIIGQYSIAVDASAYMFTARIRRIPCSSKKTNEKGVCMFAAECLQANGTHLTTCIDGIYFGSCCKLPMGTTTNNKLTTKRPTTTSSTTTVSTTKYVTDNMSDSTLNLINTNEIVINDPKNNSVIVINGSTTYKTPAEEENEDNLLGHTEKTTANIWESVSSTESVINRNHSASQITLAIPSTMLPKTTTEVPTTISEVITKTKPMLTTRPYLELSSKSSTTSTRISTTPRTPSTSPLTSSTVPSTPTLLTSTHGYSNNINMSNYKEVCGRRLIRRKRIVGGTTSRYGDWPWQLSLMVYNRNLKTFLHKCGATLLNENWAITAAHCVQLDEPQNVMLRLGDYDLSNEKEPYKHEFVQVQIIAIHQQFDRQSYEYDLALLRFNESIQFKPNIIPICIPETDDDFVGRTAYATGWGRLREDGPLPSIVNQIAVPVLSNNECVAMYRRAGFVEYIPEIFMCAGKKEGEKDSCEGDSGGPLVLQRDDDRYLLAGIISWGIECAQPNQPGVYVRVSYFRDWINQIIQF